MLNLIYLTIVYVAFVSEVAVSDHEQYIMDVIPVELPVMLQPNSELRRELQAIEMV